MIVVVLLLLQYEQAIQRRTYQPMGKEKEKEEEKKK